MNAASAGAAHLSAAGLNWADCTILAVLVLSVLMGLWRGFVGEVVALACWGLAFWVAWLFGDRLAERFSASISVPSARIMLAYAVCFITVLIAGAIVSFLLRKLVQGSGLTGSDRMLGMLFGLARGLVVVTLAVLLLGFTPFPRDAWWQDSRLMPSFENGARWLATRLPESVSRYLEPAAALAATPPKTEPKRAAPPTPARDAK